MASPHAGANLESPDHGIDGRPLPRTAPGHPRRDHADPRAGAGCRSASSGPAGRMAGLRFRRGQRCDRRNAAPILVLTVARNSHASDKALSSDSRCRGPASAAASARPITNPGRRTIASPSIVLPGLGSRGGVRGGVWIIGTTGACRPDTIGRDALRHRDRLFPQQLPDRPSRHGHPAADVIVGLRPVRPSRSIADRERRRSWSCAGLMKSRFEESNE